MQWTSEHIPDLTGKTALVTGANSGIGYETAKALALKGATVVLACRNQKKAEDAAVWIRDHRRDARLSVLHLDLGSLATVQECAAAFNAQHSQLDILVNNAGLVAMPRKVTSEGHEMQFAVNYLGHFALTARLLPRLLAAPAARVVCVSSLTYKAGRFDFDDLEMTRGYSRWGAYGRSKLAQLLFAEELDRRFRAAGATAHAIAAHPGFAQSDMREGNKANYSGWLENAILRLGDRTLAIPAEQGALPSLYAATCPEAQGGRFYGPDSFFHLRGYPAAMAVSRKHIRPDDAQRLWEASERLTGIKFTV
jgi:NAD(P)-dependent dehydrogenase (short-subunit alcohol dehydrogenase family)